MTSSVNASSPSEMGLPLDKNNRIGTSVLKSVVMTDDQCDINTEEISWNDHNFRF
ncbi:hypothetical protein DAPPUDRAFT_329853 [Daphnia pulex]|uniref:Uncharacterized protein n=1 Tax=Daphnia pulex TaxID=6669 RepID=E9HHT9_DAPPU|nr:hypothetical protein DAPPUDRAFT_329853 [Daphnia pulex]|eukprot:EFX68708.1 hypothetical protein DAPPUDRAFT_329853 [Daphnia pulex]